MVCIEVKPGEDTRNELIQTLVTKHSAYAGNFEHDPQNQNGKRSMRSCSANKHALHSQKSLFTMTHFGLKKKNKKIITKNMQQHKHTAPLFGACFC